MHIDARFLALTAFATLSSDLAFAFTAEQAEAGRAVFTQSCAACHGADLRTVPTAPLQGDEFIAKWRTRSTNDLLAQLRTTMPPESPGSLGEDGYLDVMAYLLQRNGNAPSEQRLLAASGEPIAAGAGGAAAAAGAAPPRPTGLLVRGTVEGFVPLTDQVLRNPAPGDWPMIRRDYSASSFSPLDEITAGNVGQLQLAWIWPMRDGGTNQPAPLVYRGTDLSQQPGRRDAGHRRARWQLDLGAPHRDGDRVAWHRFVRGQGDFPERRAARRAERAHGRARVGCADAGQPREQQRPASSRTGSSSKEWAVASDTKTTSASSAPTIPTPASSAGAS